jgi:hypothetical protein
MVYLCLKRRVARRRMIMMIRDPDKPATACCSQRLLGFPTPAKHQRHPRESPVVPTGPQKKGPEFSHFLIFQKIL